MQFHFFFFFFFYFSFSFSFSFFFFFFFFCCCCFFYVLLSAKEKISNSNADQKISRFQNFRVPWIMVSKICTGPSITALFLSTHNSTPDQGTLRAKTLQDFSH